MTKLEQCARALEDTIRIDCGFDIINPRETILAVIEALYEPNEGDVRAVLVRTDVTAEHLDAASAVIEGMPSLAPERQQQGIDAAAHLIRDWQAMLNTIRREA